MGIEIFIAVGVLSVDYKPTKFQWSVLQNERVSCLYLLVAILR